MDHAVPTDAEFAPASVDPALARAFRAERTMVLVRWGGVAFALVQTFTYYRPFAPGTQAWALGLTALLAVGNVVATALLPRIRGLDDARRFGLAGLLLDALVVLGFIFVFTFDADTAVWALVYVLPLEGAVRFQLRGALWTMAGATLIYTLREIYGQAVFGTPLLATSISFRMGIGFLIAVVAGTTARDLVRERDSLEQASRDLSTANAELLAASTVKDDFLAMTNHELRTPLVSVLGFARLLRARWAAMADEQRTQAMDSIVSQGERLQRLVEDLLTLTADSAGHLDVKLETLDVATAVREVLAGDAEWAQTVANRCPPDLKLRADPERFGQILVNFLTNATKYGAPPVAIDAYAAEDAVVVRVADSGEGVPEHFVPQLFERFAQAERGNRTAEGSGLGLAIVRLLAAAQGGRTWHEPNEPHGARFCIALPAADA